jgi:hypothetical protein
VDADGVHDIIGGASLSGGPGAAIVYSGADGTVIHTLPGESAGDLFGYAVGPAGDVDEDGRDDVLVGARGSSVGGASSGRAYIYSGLDGSLIRTLEAEGAGDLFGSGAAGVDDVNGDGISDQIVGAPGAGANGKAYVFSGADGTLLFDTDANAGGSTYGEFFVAGLGDVDKDGVRDVYAGDYGANGGEGRAYVYSGADGSVIHVFAGTAGEGVGPGRGAGDVDGDGYDDLVIGHWASSAGAASGGRVRVYSGRDGSVSRTITGNVAGANLGFDAVGVGDVNDDGRIDFLLSAASANRVYVVAGDMDPLAPDFVGGNRTLAFAPPAGPQPMAVRVQLWNVYNELLCPPRPFPMAELADHEVAVRWLGAPASFSENSSPPDPEFVASPLQCCPHFRDWSVAALAADFPAADVAVIHAFGAEVVPCSAYDVQFVDTDCADLADPSCYSDPTRVNTPLWGDIWAPFGLINFVDIGKVVEKYKSIPYNAGPPESGAPPKARAMLRGNVVPLGGLINFEDIGRTVNAYKTIPYGEAGPSACTEVCP